LITDRDAFDELFLFEDFQRLQDRDRPGRKIYRKFPDRKRAEREIDFFFMFLNFHI